MHHNPEVLRAISFEDSPYIAGGARTGAMRSTCGMLASSHIIGALCSIAPARRPARRAGRRSRTQRDVKYVRGAVLLLLVLLHRRVCVIAAVPIGRLHARLLQLYIVNVLVVVTVLVVTVLPARLVLLHAASAPRRAYCPGRRGPHAACARRAVAAADDGYDAAGRGFSRDV